MCKLVPGLLTIKCKLFSGRDMHNKIIITRNVGRFMCNNIFFIRNGVFMSINNGFHISEEEKKGVFCPKNQNELANACVFWRFILKIRECSMKCVSGY